MEHTLPQYGPMVLSDLKVQDIDNETDLELAEVQYSNEKEFYKIVGDAP